MNAYQIAAAQSAGRIVCIVDMARAFDPCSADAAGVKVDRLLVTQPSDEGQAFEIMESVVRSGAVDVLARVSDKYLAKQRAFLAAAQSTLDAVLALA